MTTYWYIIALALLGFLALNFFVKLQKNKKEYHDEIKDHHEKVDRELKLNKTVYKNLFYRGKKIGEIYGMANKGIVENKEVIVDKKKSSIEVVRNFLILGVRTNSIFKLIWLGKNHLVLKYEDCETDYIRKAIHVKPDINLEYYLGYFVPIDKEIEVNVFDNLHRTMLDRTMNAMGNQMKNFAEVRDVWGHLANMKQLDIEAIKEEKKLMPTRAR